MLQNEIADLLKAVGRGDGSAHDRIYLAYHRRLRVMLSRKHRPLTPQDVEDLVQDVFERLWLEPHVYDATRSAFSTWLSHIANNRAIDLLRKKGIRFELNARPEAEEEGEEWNPHQDVTDLVLRDVESGEIREWLERCLERLSEAQREAFLVRRLLDVKIKDYVVEQGIPESTFRRHSNQAHTSLRECLNPLRASEDRHDPA